jgi:hypothetical protein
MAPKHNADTAVFRESTMDDNCEVYRFAEHVGGSYGHRRLEPAGSPREGECSRVDQFSR